MFNVYESLIVTCMLEIRIEGLDAQKQTVCGFFVDVKRETAFKQEEKAPTRCEEMWNKKPAWKVQRKWVNLEIRWSRRADWKTAQILFSASLTRLLPSKFLQLKMEMLVGGGGAHK